MTQTLDQPPCLHYRNPVFEPSRAQGRNVKTPASFIEGAAAVVCYSPVLTTGGPVVGVSVTLNDQDYTPAFVNCPAGFEPSTKLK